MKKYLVIHIAFFVFFQQNAIAQLLENTPCTAVCLDVTKGSINGRMPAVNGLSNNKFLPCGSGTSEDNPTWFSFRPTGNSVTFSIIATNCSGGGCGDDAGVQATIWAEGQDGCNDLTAVQCAVGPISTLTAIVTGLKTYYLQIDGMCESQCNIAITYDKNQFVSTVEKPKITGQSSICKGTKGKYKASFPSSPTAKPNSWKWSLEPLTAGTISQIATTDSVLLNIVNPPANGKIKLSVEPVFKGKCAVIVQKESIEIDIIDLKPATCSVNICPNEQPYDYNLEYCLKSANPSYKGNVIPNNFKIDLAPGTQKVEKINFTSDNSCASGTITLNINVAKVGGSAGATPCDCAAKAGVMEIMPLLSSKNLGSELIAVHKASSASVSSAETYAYVLHEGESGTIVNPIAINKTGVFLFDMTKMKCNRIYYVSYVVGTPLNGLPDKASSCYKIVPRGQAIAWFCK